MQAKNRRGDGAGSRAAVIEAALWCFVERGIAETKIATIRRRSGVSVGSIYHHFGGKDGLAAAVYLEGLKRYHEALLEEARRKKSARSLVYTIVQHHLDWSAEHPAWMGYLMNMRRSRPVLVADDRIREVSRELVRELSRLIYPYIEKGEMVRLPMQLYTPLIIGPAQELVRQWLRDPERIDLHKMKGPLAQVVWKALQPGKKGR